MPRSRQFFGPLESLRGIAALLVVLYHVSDWPNPVTHRLFVRNGYLMVDLFFVLSGFVICHNYALKINRLGDVGRFMWLRLGRLYPLHFFFLLIFLGIEIMKKIGELKFGLVPKESAAFSINNGSSFLAHLFLVHPFFAFADKTYDAPSWSIGVEFYMYLFFFLIVLATCRRRIFLTAGLLILLAGFSLHSLSTSGLHVMNGLPAFLRCCLGFFTGVLIYQVHDRFHSAISRGAGRWGWGMLLALVAFLSVKPFGTEWDYLLPFLCGGLILALADVPAESALARVFNTPFLRWLGKVSYSIYLSHEVVMIFMGRALALTVKLFRHHFPRLDDPLWLSGLGLMFVALSILIILVVSHFTHKWIEVPGQKKFQQWAASFWTPALAATQSSLK